MGRQGGRERERHGGIEGGEGRKERRRHGGIEGGRKGEEGERQGEREGTPCHCWYSLQFTIICTKE